MNAREEQVLRLALKRRQALGTMSEEAFSELERAVRDRPQDFVDDDAEAAFAVVVRALDNLNKSRRDDDLLNDEEYLRTRQHRLALLLESCNEALSIDERCTDAALLAILATDDTSEAKHVRLRDFERRLSARLGRFAFNVTGDAWADVFCRPRLRVMEALARSCVCTARYRMARDVCDDLLANAPLDAVGARYTCALAMARLEDEDGFNWLDSREGRRGNAWFHLSRVLLMYKLGRMSAARRALAGYDRLCEGGAYVLLQPMYVDTYLPDRPPFEPGGFLESMLAVHEADPIIADVPDFAVWASEQPGFLDSAQRYCAAHGLDWRDWDEGPGLM